MNCRHAEQLQSYSQDHSLSESDRIALARHMAQCTTCQSLEERYQKLVAKLSTLAADEPSADLLQRAVASLEAPSADHSRLSNSGFPMSLLRRKENRIMFMRCMGIAGVIVVGVGTTLVGTNQRQAYAQTVLH